MLRLNILIPILLISLCELCAQSCLKKCHLAGGDLSLFILALVCYFLICLLLYKSYDTEGMGLVNIIWSSMSILLVLGGGSLFFHEKITRMDIFGVMMVVTGIFCILWEK